MPLKEHVADQIKKDNDAISSWEGHILDSKWLTESIKLVPYLGRFLKTVLLITNFFRSRGLVSELPYLLPTELLEDEVMKVPSTKASSLYPADFDLEKFNSCVPERRAVLDHPNKDISVMKLFQI